MEEAAQFASFFPFIPQIELLDCSSLSSSCCATIFQSFDFMKTKEKKALLAGGREKKATNPRSLPPLRCSFPFQ